MKATGSNVVSGVPEYAIVDIVVGNHKEREFNDPFSNFIIEGDVQSDEPLWARAHSVKSKCFPSVAVSQVLLS